MAGRRSGGKEQSHPVLFGVSAPKRVAIDLRFPLLGRDATLPFAPALQLGSIRHFPTLRKEGTPATPAFTGKEPARVVTALGLGGDPKKPQKGDDGRRPLTLLDHNLLEYHLDYWYGYPGREYSD